MRYVVLTTLPLFVALTLADALHRRDDDTGDGDSDSGDIDLDGEDRGSGPGDLPPDFASGLSALVSDKGVDDRALRVERARKEELADERVKLKGELERSQKEEQDQREAVRVSDATAMAAQRRFRDQITRVDLEYRAKTTKLNRSLASCQLVTSKTVSALNFAHEELVSEHARLTVLEASVNASQKHLLKWQQLVETLMVNYTADRKDLRDALAQEAKLQQEVASDEASITNRTSEIHRETESEQQLREAYSQERQAHEHAATRADAAIGSASKVWSLHLQDLSEKKSIVSALRRTQAEMAATQEQWTASDKKLHDAIEADLRNARLAEAELNGQLKAALAQRDQGESDLLKLREERSREREGAGILEKRIRDLQGKVDVGRSLVSKGVELMKECRSAAARHGKDLEQDFEKKLDDMKHAFASDLARQKAEMRNLSEKSKATEDSFRRDHVAAEKDKRLLGQQNAALRDEIDAGDQLRRREEAQLEDLRAQHAVLTDQNKVLNGNLVSQHKTLKDVTDRLQEQEKAQELKRFDTVKTLQNENADLRVANEAMRSKLNTERTVLARENAGLADENRALLKVVSELKDQLDAARRGNANAPNIPLGAAH